jgi:hypothetical protein
MVYFGVSAKRRIAIEAFSFLKPDEVRLYPRE